MIPASCCIRPASRVVRILTSSVAVCCLVLLLRLFLRLLLRRSLRLRLRLLLVLRLRLLALCCWMGCGDVAADVVALGCGGGVAASVYDSASASEFVYASGSASWFASIHTSTYDTSTCSA